MHQPLTIPHLPCRVSICSQHPHQIHQARWSFGLTLTYLPLFVIQIPTSRCAFRVGFLQHLSNGLKVDKFTEIPSTSLFYLLGRICSSISQAMGKADLDLCFIFLPLVCCLQHKTTSVLGIPAKFRPCNPQEFVYEDGQKLSTN